MRPCLNFANQLGQQPIAERNEQHQEPILHDVIAHGDQQQRGAGQGQTELFEHFLKRGHDDPGHDQDQDQVRNKTTAIG
jgi:hypothetical protein